MTPENNWDKLERLAAKYKYGGEEKTLTELKEHVRFMEKDAESCGEERAVRELFKEVEEYKWLENWNIEDILYTLRGYAQSNGISLSTNHPDRE